MEQKELKSILSSAYSINTWKPILSMLFGNKIEYLTKSKVITDERIKSGGHIGNIRLDDGKNIAIFDMEVADSINIRKNRKGLRDIAADYIDQALTHAALVFYYSSNQADYRLTYIAKQTYFTPEGEFIAKETAPKRYTFLLGKNESCTTAAIRLLELAEKRKRGSLYLVDVTDTFSVEKLNNDFFNRYKDFYRQFCHYIIDNDNYRTSIFDIKSKEELNHKLNKPIRDFVKKMMGRIVFLHFLQKKGWMGCSPDTLEWRDGDKEFMLNLFNEYQAKDHFYSKCLTELFFNTLNNNTRGEEQIFQLTGTRVPYLNGGLFDEDLPKARHLDFSARLFGDFLNFFAEYNFTIDENSPEEQEVGIDPEMLGHIFENLLEDNKDKGTFYTPKEIVYYMCKESLLHYLCSHTEEGLHPHLAMLVRDHKLSNELQDNKDRANKIDSLLINIKICDPAIGSGAFPMGMLHEIFSIRRKLYPELPKQCTFDPARVKKEIIQHSIYGVDIEKGAVDIARLRFWLALVVDEEKPIPLPNLDFKIMQGDSLLERYKDTDLSKILEEEDDSIYAEQGILNFGDDNHLVREVTIFDTVSRKELDELIDMYFDFEQSNNTKYNTKYDVKAKIYSIIEGKLLAVVMQEKYKLENELRKLQVYIDGNRIANTDTNADKKKKEKNLKKLYKQLDTAKTNFAEVKGSIEQLKRLLKDVNAEKPYFLWHTFFKNVFDSGGFDIVIGNPPYGAKLSKEQKDTFKAIYKDVHMRTPETFNYFISLSLKSMKKGAVLSFIVPNNLFFQNENTKTRELLIFQKRLINAINLGDNTFENADVPTCIFVAQNTNMSGAYQFSYSDVRSKKIKDIDWYNSAEKISTTDVANISGAVLGVSTKTISILKTIEKQSYTIDEIAEEVASGISTGGDKIFRVSAEKAEELNFEKELLKPVLVGSEIDKYKTENLNNKLIYTTRNTNISNYLNLNTYLLESKSILENRSETKSGILPWFSLGRQRFRELFEEPKIIMRQTSDSIRATFDDKGFYVLNSILVFKIKSDFNHVDYKLVLAILNSKLSNYIYKNLTQEEGRTFAEVKPANVRKLFIPKIGNTKQQPFCILVDYMLFLRNNSNCNVSDLVSNDFIANYFEEIIDGCVYELYFETHMRELEINILDEVSKRLRPIHQCATEKEKAAIILNVFTEIKKTDNPIRTRLELFRTRSINILKPIIEG